MLRFMSMINQELRTIEFRVVRRWAMRIRKPRWLGSATSCGNSPRSLTSCAFEAEHTAVFKSLPLLSCRT